MKPASKMPPKTARIFDDIQTPPEAVLPILPYISKDWKIWESAAGDGKIVDLLRRKDYDVQGTDIKSGFNFLDSLATYGLQFDCILTNPPYSKKDEWLERCFQIGKPFALLMPVTALGEQRRVAMYEKYGIQVGLLKKRINFPLKSGKTKNWFYCCWFCLGLPFPQQITVLG